MKPNKLKRIIVSVMLALMFFAGVGHTTAEAQRRGVRRHGPVIVYRPLRPYWGPRWGWGWSYPWGRNYPFWNRTVTVVNPIAEQRESGYRDGHKRGKDDARHGKEYAPASHKHYRDSHSLTYRQAFLQGYADGYHEQMDEAG